MLKGKAFVEKMRPDLLEMGGRHVDARVTISMCDDRGIPRQKDRFFVVTARVERQVKMGKRRDGTDILQDRANPHHDFDRWNFDGDGKLLGQPTLRLKLQHYSFDDAHSIGCWCQRAIGAPVPPGRAPYCRTDGDGALRWTGETFQQIECPGSACPLRQPVSDSRGNRIKQAKTDFTLIGRLDEEDYPALLVSLTTGSDVNYREFVGLCAATETQWAAMAERAGVSIPFQAYGLPLELTIFQSTGEGSRYPRVDYRLGCDLEQAFRMALEAQRRAARMMRGLSAGAESIPADRLLAAQPEIQELDAAEVLFPAPAMPEESLESRPKYAPSPAAQMNRATQQSPQPAQQRPTTPEAPRQAVTPPPVVHGGLSHVVDGVIVDVDTGEIMRSVATSAPVEDIHPDDVPPFASPEEPHQAPVQAVQQQQQLTVADRLITQFAAATTEAHVSAIRTEYASVRRQMTRPDQARVDDAGRAAVARVKNGGTR